MCHNRILAYQREQYRFKTAHAGRRSFKTELAKRKLALESGWRPNRRYFYGSPTRDQAKRIAWQDLKDLVKGLEIYRDASESELFIRTLTNSEIHVIGFDKPERFEGTLWHGGVLDEFADMKASVWKESVRPALMDTHGWCWLIGVPSGKNHYYELCEYARGSGDPNWADYNWLSEDVLDASEIEQLKSQYDERTYRQECCGSFESYEGRAYIYYDSKVHRKTQPFNPRVPVCVACDFNLDPCLWLIGQDVSGKISVQEEISQRRTNIWAMCNTLKDRLNSRIGRDADKHLVIFYGDFEHGQSRSVSAVASSWTILQQEFAGWRTEFRLRSNPRVIDRINAVNSKLRSAKGTIQLEVDPVCIELHKDFEIVSMDMLQSPTQKNTMPDRTHASDALGYWVNYEYPIIGRGGKLVEGK